MTEVPQERNKDYLIHFKDSTMNTKEKDSIMIDHLDYWGQWMFFEFKKSAFPYEEKAYYHKTNAFYKAVGWCELPGVQDDAEREFYGQHSTEN